MGASIGSAGTVRSVALTVPAILSVAGSPVTSSGTLAVTLATETKNLVFVGPLTGSAATPTFRALGNADIPLTESTKTADYTATVDDGVIYINTNSINLTLPAANAMVGQKLWVMKIGSDTNQSTIQRAGSDTLRGTASTTSTKVATQGECVCFISDGSTIWTLVSRTYPMGWISYSPALSASLGTPVVSTWFYRRIGDSAEVTGFLEPGTTTGALLTIGLPFSTAIDSAKATVNNTTANAGMVVGQLTTNSSSGVGYMVTATGTSTSLVYMGDTGTTKLVPANANRINTNELTSIWFKVPISGWE